MAEVKKIATRDSYGNALRDLGAMDEKVVVVDGDLSNATKTGVFKSAYPDRHFNCGIAECNIMGTAAGMASMGLIPFASTFAMFASGRAYEIDGPVYIRFGRAAVPVFHNEDYDFRVGKAEILREGTDIAIIANGVMTEEAVTAGEELAKQGIHARVINMGTIKPMDEEAVLAAARECGRVIAIANREKLSSGDAFFAKEISAIDVLVTNETREEVLAPYREAGIEITVQE